MARTTALLALAFALAVPLGASAGKNRAGSVPLVPLAAGHFATCEGSGLLRPVCPRLVPRVREYGTRLYVEPYLDLFDLGRGADHPRQPELDRPPRMLHVVVVAGDLERLTSFREPPPQTGTTLRDGLVREERSRPVGFGRVRWRGRYGAFYLMPSWPRGGMLGNHLVFSWREQARRYALSLHAWEPLTESAQTLRALVESIPSVGESRRLARLSPVLRLALPRGESAARARIEVPSARRLTLEAHVVTRAGAEFAVLLETRDGDLDRLLDSAGPACRIRMPYRLCSVRVPAVAGVRAIVVEKRSLAPTSVRVDLVFRRR